MLWTKPRNKRQARQNKDHRKLLHSVEGGLPNIKLEKNPGRVFLHPPKAENCEAWNKVRGQNRDFLMPLEPRWPADCLDRDFYARRLKYQIECWALDSAYPFLIFKKSDGQLIGGININNVSRGAAQYASLGYWLDQDHQGQGYMSEALKLTLGFCFNALKLHRINAAVLPTNNPSINLLIRNGFHKEGYAEKYIKINGQWQDHILFGLPIEKSGH